MLVVLAAALATAVVPRLFGYDTYVIYGGSMGDALPDGSVAIAGWIEGDKVRPGDVIVVGTDTDGQRLPKAHRVESVWLQSGERVIQTKGDANSGPDPAPVVLGEDDRAMKVQRYVPWAGHAVHLVQTPPGWIVAVVMPSAVVCIAAIHGTWAKARPKKRIEQERWA
ncbi:MAG: signal peptidase I [Chloroflexi bacterium]|nr:signal peptidase I [Chloroflexota bacterium]